MEFKRFVSALWRWSWLIVLATGLAAGLSYWRVHKIPRVYESSATVLVGRSLQSENPNPADFQASQELAKNYAVLARSQPILQATADALKLNVPWYALSPEVNAIATQGTETVQINVVDLNPRRAELIANEIAHQLVLQSPTPKASDPQRQFANQQMAKLESQIKANQSEIATLQKQADHETSALALQDLRNKIGILQQQVQGWQNTYAQLSNFYQGSTTNYLSIVNQATLPTKPVGTSVRYDTLLAGGVGFALAVAGIALIELLDDTVRTQKDGAKTLAVPVLGGIGPLPKVSRRSVQATMAKRSGLLRWVLRPTDYLFTLNAPLASVTEACRLVTTNFLASLPSARVPTADAVGSAQGKLLAEHVGGAAIGEALATRTPDAQALVVTSPGPAEGKSVIASNLAITLAQAGQRVILVDANLRRPSLHRLFGLPNEKGLTTLLADRSVSIVAVLQDTAVPWLRLLTSGPLSTNPGQLLASKDMAERLAELKASADIVVFDTPGVLGGADTTVLGAMCDCAIMVVRAGRTRRNVAKQAKATLAQVGLAIAGVVLNGSEIGRKTYREYYALPASEAVASAPTHCPHLGLSTDPASTVLGATPAHRCYVNQKPGKIESQHQVAFCLAGGYKLCPRLVNVGNEQTAVQPKPQTQTQTQTVSTPGFDHS